MTACDLAVREKHHYVAQYLESKMVFAVSGVSSGSGNNGHGGHGANSGGGNSGGGGGTPESVVSADSARASSYEEDEEDYEDEEEEEEEAVYCGLRSKDLQEAKEQESRTASFKLNLSRLNKACARWHYLFACQKLEPEIGKRQRKEKAPLLPQLIVDTSEMLGVPLFTAEALLRFCEWSKEALRIEWARDPVQTCLRAGLAPPYSILGLAQPQQSQYVQYRTAAGRQGRSLVYSPSFTPWP